MMLNEALHRYCNSGAICVNFFCNKQIKVQRAAHSTDVPITDYRSPVVGFSRAAGRFFLIELLQSFARRGAGGIQRQRLLK